MSVQNNLITTYFKSKPQGNAIIILLLIDTIIVVQDLLEAVSVISLDLSLAIIVLIDIAICVLIYQMIKIPNKMKILYPDTQSILVATLKEITRLSFMIFALEILWYVIILFIMGFTPGFLNSIALFAPLIIALVARSSAATALNNPNFMKELELAANPPARVHLSSHNIYQQQAYNPNQPQNQAESQYVPPNQNQYQPPIQNQYQANSEAAKPIEDRIDRCPHCGIEAEGENYCSNCGGSLRISKK